MSGISFAQSENGSRFNPPRDFTDAEYEFVDDLRITFQRCETHIKEELGVSRERSYALQNLEQALSWIEKAVNQTGLLRDKAKSA